MILKIKHEEKIPQLIELTKEGKTNLEICRILGMKHSTFCIWKREVRLLGYDVPENSGRPKKKITNFSNES